jgi:hypothetical protein
MAGTLVIGTLSDGTNSTSSSNCIQGSAKVWVNFNGVTTATIRASYNVSSVTRNSAGDYTVNFTTALSDANYASVISVGLSSSLLGIIIGSTAAVAPTASAFRFSVNNTVGTATDATYVSVGIFR